MKKVLDFMFSLIGVTLLLPLFIIIAIIIKLTSKGSVLYNQKRVGKDFKLFSIHKFRTMVIDADRKGLKITIGDRDPRITLIGYFLRKYKIDELPQLFNVLKGEMSLVGPRPEVEKYVLLYNEEQRKVLSVLPGITDLASIKFRDESEILKSFDDPEDGYINKVMPQKLELNLQYIKTQSLLGDLKIILQTLKVI